MSKRKALGQGLDALLGGDIDLSAPPTVDRGEGGVVSLPIGELVPNPDQPRSRFDETALGELAESIKQQGIIQPILVERKGDGEFRIVAGERRYRAAKIAGLSEIPVLVRDFTEEQKLEIALVENVQREDLTPMEEARAYYHIMDVLNLSQQEVADKVGKNRSTVANSLRLLKLSEEIQTAVESGDISAGHARALLSVVNPADQTLLFSLIKTKGLSVREAEARAGAMNQGRKSEPSADKAPVSKSPSGQDAELLRLEQAFIEKLGTRVALRGTIKKGKLEISWFSKDDLERVFDLVVGSE